MKSDAHHHRRNDCRGCAAADGLKSVVDLGSQPPANALLESLTATEDELRFPLELFRCRHCGLLQLLDVVDPELLFGHYLYLTGASSTMRDHFREYARSVVKDAGLSPGSRVAEVASNDGSLLAGFVAEGMSVLGIEPARNIAEIARERGIDTDCRFFDRNEAAKIRDEHGAFAAVVANNVLAHVDDPVGFLAGMRRLVEPAGHVVVEVPWAAEMFERLEYDTIYHEHLSCFLITPLLAIFARAGLSVRRLDHQSVHGGTLRLTAVPGPGAHADSVRVEADREQKRGLLDDDAWSEFARRVADNRKQLRKLLEELAGEGRSVAGYGAPAKGNTLLNYCGIGPDLLAFTVDRNPLKQNRFMPGSHIPIFGVEAIAERNPDDLLILPWNLADEIIHQESAFRARGGRFIIPVPIPRVIA